MLKYQFGKKWLTHHLCGTCGLHVFGQIIPITEAPTRGKLEKGQMEMWEYLSTRRGINIKLIEEVEWNDLTLIKEDGQSRGGKFNVGWD